MHQRAAELGGSCEVSGGPGTTVRAVLPTAAAS
jgi:signal transduction histidine kinase